MLFRDSLPRFCVNVPGRKRQSVDAATAMYYGDGSVRDRKAVILPRIAGVQNAGTA